MNNPPTLIAHGIPDPRNPEEPKDPRPVDPDPSPGEPPIDPADEPVLQTPAYRVRRIITLSLTRPWSQKAPSFVGIALAAAVGIYPTGAMAPMAEDNFDSNARGLRQRARF